MKFAYMSMLIIEWLLMTIVMPVCLFLANFYGCCCPSNSLVTPPVVQDAGVVVVAVPEKPSSELAEEIQEL